MRLLRPALPAIVALILALVAPGHAPRALAISYPPGWNLVSGPAGSHLVGAEGEIFTLQPGDAEYEAFPADAPLTGGYGYWAYFPQGGWLDAAPGVETYTVRLVPGRWTLVGNPSRSVVVRLTGALTGLIFVPGAGYVSVTVIPPGIGAWVLGSGQLVLSA